MDETGDSSVLLVARCLLAGLFLWSGIGKINGYDDIGILMQEHGAMGLLLAGGDLRRARRRPAADPGLPGALRGVVAGRLLRGDGAAVPRQLHRPQPRCFHLLKNFAIVGGLLALYVSGPGRMSIDGMNDGPV